MQSLNRRSWLISRFLHNRGRRRLVLLVGLIVASPLTSADATPEIGSVQVDLVVPEVTTGPPAAGERVEVIHADSGVAIVVYLPRDWSATKSWPVIIELPGNGGFKNALGDTCTGRPQGCNLGYGVSAGEGAIWIAVPFVNAAGTDVAVKWWGDAPDYDPHPTIELLKRTVSIACGCELNGDRNRVVLAGFSRGALACNYMGLFDDDIAELWCGMICYSHYDGVRVRWPYPDSDRPSVATRLARLGSRPQFLCHESADDREDPTRATRMMLQDSAASNRFTYCSTGFRNHNDQWVLRPSKARIQLREWFQAVISEASE